MTYYQQDPAQVAELTELDLSIVQPVLTGDPIASLQSHGKAVVYLSIGEIGLSNPRLPPHFRSLSPSVGKLAAALVDIRECLRIFPRALGW